MVCRPPGQSGQIKVGDLLVTVKSFSFAISSMASASALAPRSLRPDWCSAHEARLFER
jgi:hypothetical protein